MYKIAKFYVEFRLDAHILKPKQKLKNLEVIMDRKMKFLAHVEKMFGKSAHKYTI